MAEQILWLDGEANVGIEKMCPGRHVTQNEWQPIWNEEYLTLFNKHKYDYISDYECIFNHPIGGNDLQYDFLSWQNLQAAKTQGTNVPITNLAHFTNWYAAEQICKTNGFKGEEKKINEDQFARLSWWSPLFTPQDANQVRVHLGNAIQPFLGEGDNKWQLQNWFATSDAFRPNPMRYGPTLFQYEIGDLCLYYGHQFGPELCYKILGTFGYKQEVMHAVLVCSQADGAGMFADYPDVLSPEEDVFNEAVITRDDEGNWVWKPQATGSEIIRLQAYWQPYPKYRRWENVAFAFHIPDDPDDPDGDCLIMNYDPPANHQKIINEWREIEDYNPVENE